MKYFLAIAWLALGLGFPVSATTTRGQPDATKMTRQLQKAEDLIERYDHEGAIRLLETMIEAMDEPSFEALFLLARAHLALARYPEALAAADSVIEAAADAEQRGKGYSLLGLALFESSVSEDYEFASFGHSLERLLEIMRAIESRKADALERWKAEKEAFESSRSTRLEEAVTAFRQAIALRSNAAVLDHYRLAEVLTGLGRTDEAGARLGEYFELAVGIDIPLGPQQLQCRLESDVVSTGDPIVRKVTRPRRTRSKPARYTKKAHRHRIQGKVFLEAVIDKRGNVLCARPLRGLPLGLTRQAMEAVQGSKFEPAHLDGEPIAVVYKVVVNFRLGRVPRAVEIQRRRLNNPFAT